MYRILPLLVFSACISFVSAQISFTNNSDLLANPNLRSGVALGVADMNGDGLDDLVRLQNARELLFEYQQSDGGAFTNYYFGDPNPGSEWGMAIADVDEDGYNDVMIGGVENRLKVFLMGPDGVDSTYWLPLPQIFLQAANFVDIDNDGLVDLFACNDDEVSSPYRNLGNNNWLYDLGLIDSSSPDTTDDNSGNYGSVWTDYDNDGDIDLYISKCRGGVSDPFDGRRTNLLFQNDGMGGFDEVALDVGLRPYGQSWSTDFADIDNDGDLDCFIINHDIPSKLYINENNLYTEITDSSGLLDILVDYDNGIQCIFDDFDNDTWVDLIVSGLTGHYLLRNNGDLTFSTVDAFPDGTPGMHSVSVGDLNNDGFLDILSAFAIGYNSPSNKADRLHLNAGNDNNWLKVRLRGTESNLNGIGARLELYGSWGIQIREVRGGEGYGIVTSLETHFGVGADTAIDSLVIKWPSGTRDVICAPDTNTVITVVEGCYPDCEANISLEEASICLGETYSFGGNDLAESGTYSYVGATPGGCSITNVLELTVINIDEDVVQEGNTLTAADGLQYQWIDCGSGNTAVPGATDRTFTPSVDGSYAVIVTDGTCSDTSDCFNIVGTSVFDHAFPFDISVYPNPTSGPLLVRFDEVIGEAVIRLHTVHGALITARQINSVQQVELDLRAVPRGHYILELEYDGVTGHMQLVVH